MRTLIKRYPRLLSFGVLTAVFSAAGQAFVLSFFIPHYQDELGISKTAISSIFLLATVLSASLLPLWGKILDRSSLLRYTMLWAVILAGGCLLLSWAKTVFWIFVGFFIVRNAGQGVFMIISNASMARYFGFKRGKALGIANLGYPIAEIFFPSLVFGAIHAWGWPGGWLLLAGIVVFVFMPLAWVCIGDRHHEDLMTHEHLHGTPAERAALEAGIHWTSGQMMKDKRFYILLWPTVLPPAFLTGLFFHQISLIELKGWHPSIFMSGLAVYGITRAPVSFLIGPVIDRFTAKKLFPFCPVPIALGILVFMFASNPLWSWLYMALIGAGLVLGMVISSALWAEMYGTKHLGAIRGINSTAMVLGTGISPVIIGSLLDAHVAPTWIFVGMLFFIAVAMFQAFSVCYSSKTHFPLKTSS